MASRKTLFVPVSASLADLAGQDYIHAVCGARAALTGRDVDELLARAEAPVDFYPTAMQQRVLDLLPRVGSSVAEPLHTSAAGASTIKFNEATHTERAPLSGFGPYRIGEDGRLFLTTKSEHYHAPLGHAFPGYRLMETARALGIPNATHNNTRGHITRTLEEELVRTANGIARGDADALSGALDASNPTALNRVLNLETGSLAMEAVIKLMLARFYRSQQDAPEPVYAGRVPVMVVVGDEEGGIRANYHGTTLTAQCLRGMWDGIRSGMESSGLMRVCSVRPNNVEELEAVFAERDSGGEKIAGFFHEIVLMNYGGRLLTREFLERAYALCEQHDVPTVVDEIQSCLWSPTLYMYLELGLRPTFTAIGKGFPGGEYPASRVLFNARMDSLPQFGALVTNGQEEIASLAYLVTMRWAEENAEVTGAIGEYYEQRLRDLVDAHGDQLSAFEGRRHLASLYFHELGRAKAFVERVHASGLDISVQSYKAACPPGALTKLPLIAGYEIVDTVLEKMEAALKAE